MNLNDPFVLVPMIDDPMSCSLLGCSCGELNGKGSGGDCDCGTQNGGGAGGTIKLN